MPATAIDIGTHTIKALVGKPGKNPVINNFAYAPNPTGLSVAEDEAQANQLLEVIDSFFHDYKLPKSEIRLSLPEEVVSTKVIHLPPLTDSELAYAIDWQAEQHIPIPLNHLTLEYQVLYRPPKRDKDQAMRVLLIGTKKNVVDLYTDIFLNLGIQPAILETQVFSIIRSLGFDRRDPTTMIVHLGASNTQIIIVEQNEVQLAANKSGGGKLFTKSIQQSIQNLTKDQAEEYKKSYGLLQDQLEGKIRNAIDPAINSVAQEVNKTLRFYNNQKPDAPVTRIVLSGGTSQMPGIVEYFANITSTEVLIAAPFAPARGSAPEENQQAFLVCMGMMMRE